jgi:hypothetical protein
MLKKTLNYHQESNIAAEKIVSGVLHYLKKLKESRKK